MKIAPNCLAWLCVVCCMATHCLANLAAEQLENYQRLEGYTRLEEHQEQVRMLTSSDGVRCVIDAPLKHGKQRTLVLYATPNGNTLEQTWGCQSQPGRDWHFDIQHVAAQMRALRQWITRRSSEHELWFAVLQAPQLSWPEYRAQHADSGQRIRGIIQYLEQESRCDETILAAHSGGGAFILDGIQAHSSLPDSWRQILFLDANYSYDDALHADKLLQWLHQSPEHSLTVLAYDDREITLNGRKVVSESGGTYRATQRMQQRLMRDVPLEESRAEDFVYQTALGGQVSMAIHQNPDNKILHTALIGEMNGLQAAIRHHVNRVELLRNPPPPGVGSAAKNVTWPELATGRNYAQWISKEPIALGAFARLAVSQLDLPSLAVPERAENAMSGSAFAQALKSTAVQQRQSLIATELAMGNVPSHCRQMVGIDVELIDASFHHHTGRYYVTSDYVSIGSDDDFFRIPMQPDTAWTLSQATNSLMITAKIVDDLHACARWRLKPQPLTDQRESVETFWLHQQLIERELASARPRAEDRSMAIISGIKKDLVLTNSLLARPNRVAIYGWHNSDGLPIQPLYVGHVDHYVDYSHGVRLMSQRMLVDGQTRAVQDVLNDPSLCGLLSREGPINPLRIVDASGWFAK